MDEPFPKTLDPARIRVDLEQSRAELAAGRVVSLESVLDRMWKSIERMEARQNALPFIDND